MYSECPDWPWALERNETKRRSPQVSCKHERSCACVREREGEIREEVWESRGVELVGRREWQRLLVERKNRPTWSTLTMAR